MTQEELIEYVKRCLGAPYIKLEITDDHIIDNINRSIAMYKKWAMGNATQEVYFTFPTTPGTSLYKLPDGVLDVLAYSGRNIASGINTLFTIENYMFSQGMFNGLTKTSSEYSIVDMHIVKEFLETLNRYTTDKYIWKYHKIRNQLELKPAPTDVQYLLIKVLALEGSFIGTSEDEYNEYFYDKGWIQDYTIAKTKVTLGYIRRKFASFNSIGNTGLALDGSEMIQEGMESITSLEERLKSEEVFEGWDFIVG